MSGGRETEALEPAGEQDEEPRELRNAAPEHAVEPRALGKRQRGQRPLSEFPEAHFLQPGDAGPETALEVVAQILDGELVEMDVRNAA